MRSNRVGGLLRSILLLSVFMTVGHSKVGKIDHALKHISSDYPYEIDLMNLEDDALHGITSKLDKYSQYLKPLEADNFLNVTDGQFSGYGLQLRLFNKKLVIVHIIPNSPADESSLRVGDEITHINTKPINTESLESNVIKMRQSKKKSMLLTLNRPGRNEIQLMKNDINLPSIFYEKQDKIGYIRIKLFSKTTPEEMLEAIDELAECDALLFDLRDNPGGLLSSSIFTTDFLMPNEKKQAIMQIHKNKGETIIINGSHDDATKGKPIFVLVNKNTASGGELFSRALQYHKRAMIIGQPTHGKGTMQSIIPFKDGSVLKLTTAFFTGPDGSPVEQTGVIPDKQIILEHQDVIPNVKEIIYKQLKNWSNYE